MKIENITFVSDKISYTRNNILGQKFQLKPNFTRNIGKINDSTYFCELKLLIQQTEDNPFPMNIEVNLKGIFVIREITDEEEVKTFLQYDAVDMLYPYIRSIVSSVTSSALIQPILLPFIRARDLFKKNNQEESNIVI